jgi:electron transport complex protein RnfG
MVVVLTVICGTSGFVLSFVNTATEEAREYQLLKYVKGPSIKAVLPEHDNDPIKEALVLNLGQDEKGKPIEKKLFPGKKGGKLVALAYDTAATGYHGDISVMIGLDPEGTLTGVSIMTHTETPGLGAKVEESVFTDQFKGLTGELAVGEDINGVSGATISSKGVVTAVNEGIKLFPKAMKEAS